MLFVGDLMYCKNSQGNYALVKVLESNVESAGVLVEFEEPFHFHIIKVDGTCKQYYFDKGEAAFIPKEWVVSEKDS